MEKVITCTRHGLSPWIRLQKEYGICRASAHHKAGAELIYEAMARTKLHKFKQLHTIEVKHASFPAAFVLQLQNRQRKLKYKPVCGR